MEGYNIAIRDLKRTMWMEVGRVTANTQKFHIKDLQDDQEYLIRVFARNEIGMSEPLESDEPYLAISGKGKWMVGGLVVDLPLLTSCFSHHLQDTRTRLTSRRAR